MPHIVFGNWNGIGYATCLECLGPAEVGFVIPNSSSKTVELLSLIYIKEYFGNRSFILSNGVIVLSDIELQAYYLGMLDLPHTYEFEYHDANCDGCFSDCINCDSYCYDCVDYYDMYAYNDIRKTLYIPINRKDRDYFNNRSKLTRSV